MNFEDQIRILRRGTIDIMTEDELVKKLKEDRPLNVKFGVDPTAPDIHLGHTVSIQKLKQFQELNHNVQLIIGDFTAMIGDPSGRTETRPTLTKEQIETNMKTYKTQVFKILDPNKTQLLYNSNWLGQFYATDMIELGSKYTVQQLLQRRDFSNRIKQNKPLSVTELLYPLLVGYDSVHLKTDIEIGGTDQLFNFVASREIQKSYGQSSEIIMTLPLLEGMDGVRKMSKSYGNAIGVNDEPYDMYGKIMSVSDKLMLKYYELISDVSLEDIDKMKTNISTGKVNPIEYKQKLAKEIVSRYHSTEAAELAEEKFNSVHRKRDIPQDAEERIVTYSTTADLSLIKILRGIGNVKSNNEARRLIEQGAVKINGATIKDTNHVINPEKEQVIQSGKRNFTKVKCIKGQ